MEGKRVELDEATVTVVFVELCHHEDGDLAKMDNNGSRRDLIEVSEFQDLVESFLCLSSSELYITMFPAEHIFDFIASQKDVTSISLMSNSLHKIERCSRKRVFIRNCYAINPERLIEWFPSLRSLILKGKPHFTGFKLVPYEWVLRSLHLCRAPTVRNKTSGHCCFMLLLAHQVFDQSPTRRKPSFHEKASSFILKPPLARSSG